MATTVEDSDVDEAAIMVDSDNVADTLLDIEQDESILLSKTIFLRSTSNIAI